jgi:hypothetical protein
LARYEALRPVLKGERSLHQQSDHTGINYGRLWRAVRRLMAIDSMLEDLPDTPDNVAVFGRYLSAWGPSAFAQACAVYLAECGTHAIVDAGFWPGRTSERIGGFRVLRSVTPEMLVMWDRGFHDYDMFTGMALLWSTSTPVKRSGVSGENISGSVWLTTPSRSQPCRAMASLTTSSPRCWSPLWRPLWNSSVPQPTRPFCEAVTFI